MRTAQLFTVAAACLMTACTSKQVQLYATRLDALLVDYRQGVQGRLDAERNLYDQVSAVFATEAERDLYEGLKIERLRQQRILTGDLGEGRLEPSQFAEKMRETALAEFDRTRDWFDQELTVQQKYEAGLARVSLDARKLGALDAALKAVEKNADLKTALQDVTGMATTFQNEFQLQGCKSLEREVAITADTLTELKAEKPTDAAEIDAVNKRISTLTASQAAVQAKLNASPNFKLVSGSTTQKKCQ